MSPRRQFADPAGGPAIERDRHGTDMVAIEAVSISTLESLPARIWDGSPPVPIERIAEDHFGLIVLETDDPAEIPGAAPVAEGNHFSGMLVADRGEIWVNRSDAREWPPRKRFTIAHELGHWVLHRHSHDPEAYQAVDSGRIRLPAHEESDEPADGSDSRKVLPLIEAEAHAFAAAFLMPAALLRSAHSESNGNLAALQALFDSSKAALERRLRTLGLGWTEPDQLSEPSLSQQ